MNKQSVDPQKTNLINEISSPVHSILQRACACGQHTGGGGECEECRKKRENTLQRAAVNSTPVNGVPKVVYEELQSPGRPLDAATRAYMEPRFGQDFSQVRVHTGSQASESARAVNALAYTVGSQIVMDERLASPATHQGRTVLAHELTHVVQQGFRPGAGALSIGPSDGPYEAQAEQTAQRVMATGSQAAVHQSGPSSGTIQRLGPNPGCTDAQAQEIHQAIFDARGWLNRAISKMSARPLSGQAVASLRRNFGDTYGVEVNAELITNRLRAAYRELSTISFTCADATDATCAAGHCGFATAGGHAATVCTNVTLATNDAVFRAGCVLHESLHSSFSRFGVDEYSGWHGHSSTTPTYPGTGVDPLLNADSYTTLTMDLSGK